MTVSILTGDCRVVLKTLADSSVHSCVTDPPYHLTSIVKRFGAADAAPAKVKETGVYARSAAGFMGQTWDGGDVAFRPEPGGTVLDPFMGSGSTLKASRIEQFSFIGIDLDPAYAEIARARADADAPLFAEASA